MDNRALLDDTKELIVTGVPKAGKGEGRLEFRVRLGVAETRTVHEVSGRYPKLKNARRQPVDYTFDVSFLSRSPLPPKLGGPIRKAIGKGQEEGAFDLEDWSFTWRLRPFRKRPKSNF